MKYTTYLFDFDYTLADSSRGIVICFRNVLERHGHTGISDEAIKRTIGKTLEDSFSILSGITTPETLAEYKKEYVKEADTYMTVNTFFFPETVTVLKTLKSQGAQIGIISTKFRFRIREMVDQHFPKDFFDIIIGGEDVKQAKPDPQGIKKALRRLHRRKSETLYIGDSTVDAETAQAAKVDFVGVLNGMTTREELMVYPHRQILDNLSLLPLIHKFTPYEPDKHFPEKFFYSSCFPQKIVAFYKLLHQKQIRGKHEIKENPTCCVCKNCGNTFQGNYCPHCGQNRHTPRFTIRNAFQNILSGFFNIDHGFSRNLIELLYRPGYMIRDYLKGKRVHYYKPFQTLFVLAALYIMGVQLLKDPEANKELLAPHKVDTSDYEKKVQEEMAAQQTEKQEPQKQENMEQRKEQQQDKSEQMQGKRGYQPIDESKINWQELEDRWGVKRDNLEKSGDLTKMLNYGKSDLVKVKPTFGGESFELDARLSFKKDGEGNISLVPHFIRKEQKLDEYKEHKFSDNDRKNLRETGNLGRVVDIVDRETGEIIPSYISIDRKTNEITDIPASRVRIPERIGKTEITTQERDMLRAGLPVRDKLIERNDGRKFVTTLQVNVEQRGVEFVPGTGKSPRTAQTQETKGDTSKSQAQGGENAAQTKKEQRRNTWTNEDGSIRPISKWSGVSFTDQQKADYVAGKAVKLENVTDKQGFHATMYIKFNPEKGRPYRYDTNPDNAQQVAPSNESRTQVAVNNDGKTNEATKNLREPLQKGQTNPKDARQQQQQEKPQKKTGKGMKM